MGNFSIFSGTQTQSKPQTNQSTTSATSKAPQATKSSTPPKNVQANSNAQKPSKDSFRPSAELQEESPTRRVANDNARIFSAERERSAATADRKEFSIGVGFSANFTSLADLGKAFKSAFRNPSIGQLDNTTPGYNDAIKDMQRASQIQGGR